MTRFKPRTSGARSDLATTILWLQIICKIEALGNPPPPMKGSIRKIIQLYFPLVSTDLSFTTAADFVWIGARWAITMLLCWCWCWWRSRWGKGWASLLLHRQGMSSKTVLNEPFRVSFSSFSSFRLLKVIMSNIKYCWWLDSNCRSMVMEATTLTTEPQRLPI